MERWKLRSVVTEENSPQIHKALIGVLIVVVVILGVLLYMNSDMTSRIENERNVLKADNIVLKKEFDALSDKLLYYIEDQKHHDKEIDKRNKVIATLEKEFDKIKSDYDKEIIDIRSDSTITAFDAITDIFREHNSIEK